MSLKETSKRIVEKVMTDSFFRQPLFTECFTEDCECLFPYAPPGMPQYMNTWEMERCFEWLNRSVKETNNTVHYIYSTPDVNLYWGVGEMDAEVFWGHQDGHFHSFYIAKFIMEKAMVKHVTLYADPLKFLEAAGKNVPVFKMDLYDEASIEYLKSHPINRNTKKAKTNYSAAERIRYNLEIFSSGVEREKYRTLCEATEDHEGGAVFVPGEMQNYANGTYGMYSDRCHEENERDIAVAWMKASSPWVYRDPRAKYYATDDPLVYFIENYNQGPSNWRGNKCDGHYRQNHCFFMRFAEDGKLKFEVETINPMTKMMGQNIDVPSFPYYL